MIEVKQTVKHSDEQVNTRKEIQTVQTENINNEEKHYTYFGGLNNIWTYNKKKDVHKYENQNQIFSRSKIKDM